MTRESEIMALEQRRRSAMTSADVTTLSGLFANELAWIHATARLDTKDGLLGSIASGKTKYLSIECSEETVRFYGEIAIVSGLANINAEIAGEQRAIQNRFTIVWARVDGEWKVVNWQSTGVRKP